MRKLQDAARALAKCEELAREEGAEQFFTVDFFLYFATICDELGYTDRCLEKVEQAMALSPEDPVCENFYGYVLADHSRELDKAEDFINRALESEPDNYAYVDSLAWVYFRKERYGEALIEINRALRLCENYPDPEILAHAGDIYAATGFMILAERYWRSALQEDYAHPEQVKVQLEELSGNKASK